MSYLNSYQIRELLSRPSWGSRTQVSWALKCQNLRLEDTTLDLTWSKPSLATLQEKMDPDGSKLVSSVQQTFCYTTFASRVQNSYKGADHVCLSLFLSISLFLFHCLWHVGALVSNGLSGQILSIMY